MILPIEPGNDKVPDKKEPFFPAWLWPVLLAAAILVLFLASCSTVKKTSSTETSETDLLQTSKNESAAVSKSDSAGAKLQEIKSLVKKDSSSQESQESENEETITVVLEPATGKPANDYDGAPVINDVTINGHQISSSQPIASIEVKNKQGTKKYQAKDFRSIDSSSISAAETSRVAKFDSSGQRRADSLSIHQESKKTASSKKRTGFAWWFWPLVIIGSAAFLYFGFRFGWFSKILSWIIGLFRKRRPPDKNKNTLTTTNYSPPAPPGATKI